MWFQESENPSMSRIDRVLVSVVWKDHFLDVTQKASSSCGIRSLSSSCGG